MLQAKVMGILEKWNKYIYSPELEGRALSNPSILNIKKTGGRIDYIDYLRASAVLVMIFAHVLDAVLAPEYKKDDLYRFFNFMNGFVAPAFLFAAGASFTIVITKRKDDILNFRFPAFKQLWRVSQIFILGYLLHLPYKTAHQMETIMSEQQYLNFLRSDVLHVIAIGLFLSQLIFVIVRNEKKLFIIIFILALLTIAFTPFARAYNFESVFPVEIATYFNKNFNSIFPLFPWLSYIFFGSIIMFVIQKYSAEGKHDAVLTRLLYLGLAVIILASIPEFIGLKPNEAYNFWHTSSNIVGIKLGFVLLWMIFMRFLQTKFSYRMKYLKIFGQEPLFVYVFHLIIVYGSVLSTGLAHSLGRNHTRFEMFLIYLAVVIVSLIFTLVWSRIKKFSLLFARIILFSILIYFFHYFTTKLF